MATAKTMKPVRIGTSAVLYRGDCLEVLSKLPAASVDAIVTDPPYGQTNEAYDSPIAADPELWRACLRVAKPNAALISFAGSPTYHRIASAIEKAGWKVRQMWGWIYRNGFIMSRFRDGFDRLAPAMDPICFASVGRFPLALEREGINRWKRYDKVCKPGYSSRAQTRGLKEATGHWPRSIVATESIPPFEYFVFNGNHPSLKDERLGHPNQKPLRLLEWIVKKIPAPAVILDPFTGSGTTGEACLRLGHFFIGCEVDDSYFAMAAKRMRSVSVESRKAS